MARGLGGLCFAILVLAVGDLRAGEPSASIFYAEPSLRDVALRLASELTNDGFAATASAGRPATPCDLPAPKPASTSGEERAWVTLGAATGPSSLVRAIICYRGVGAPPLQTLSVAGRSELDGFALKIAEALNGLRANASLPPSESSNRIEANDPELAGLSDTREGRESRNSVTLAGTALSDVTERAALFGASLSMNLPLLASLGLCAEAFFPLSALDTENDEVSVAARMGWLRVGLRQRFAFESLAWNVSALAGPAVTWATAEAVAPRIGSADLTVGALLSLGTSLEVPSDSAAFVWGSARASTLLPSVRFQLGSERTEPYGRLLFEGSLGLGLRLR